MAIINQLYRGGQPGLLGGPMDSLTRRNRREEGLRADLMSEGYRNISGMPTRGPAPRTAPVSAIPVNVTQTPQAEPETAPTPEDEPYDFTGSPGYQWRYNEGLRALENGLIGRGLGLSGRAVKEAQRFGQNYAADEFNAEFARNASLAGLMPPSINSMNSLIGGFAQNAGNLAMNQGQIGAQSAYNNANIWGNALNNLIQGMGMYYGGGFGG